MVLSCQASQVAFILAPPTLAELKKEARRRGITVTELCQDVMQSFADCIRKPAKK